MLLKISVGLFLALCLSGFFNYSLYNKIKLNNILIEQQVQSIADLNSSLELKQSIKQITDDTFKVVIDEVKVSDKSFEVLKDNLAKIDNCKKQITKGNVDNIGDVNEIKAIDPDVVSYYDILQSAYNLQNKN